MARSNLPKKNKNGRRKPSSETHKVVKKEVDKMRKSQRREMREYFFNTMMPIAEYYAFMKLIYIAMIVTHDKFGHGKQRQTVLADGMINQYECLLSGHVSIEEIADEIYRITGHRFVVEDDELLEMARNAIGEDQGEK